MKDVQAENPTSHFMSRHNHVRVERMPLAERIQTESSHEKRHDLIRLSERIETTARVLGWIKAGRPIHEITEFLSAEHDEAIVDRATILDQAGRQAFESNIEPVEGAADGLDKVLTDIVGAIRLGGQLCQRCASPLLPGKSCSWCSAMRNLPIERDDIAFEPADRLDQESGIVN
jgi:hypothetical protein